MTFRTRVLLACIVAAVAPLAILTLGIRQEVDRTLTAQYQAGVRGLVDVIHEDVTRQSRTIDTRLAALAARIASDAPVRAAVLQGHDRPGVLDWAGSAMSVAGLNYLMLLGPSGRILSSGHFRNEYDRRAGAVDAVLGATSGPVLVRARTAEGSFLALARGRAFRMGGRRFLLAGGLAVDRRFLDRLERQEGSGDLTVALALPGAPIPSADRPGEPAAAPEERGLARRRASADSTMTAELALPFVDDAAAAPTVDTAYVVVTHSLAPLVTLEHRMDVWFAGGLLAALLLAVLIARALSARVSRPLTDLADKTRWLDLERLDIDFRSSRLDEIGTLSRLMGAMVERLRTGVAQLRQAERRATVGDMARQVNHDVRNGLLPLRNVIRHLAQVAREAPSELAPVFIERQGTLDGGIAYLEGLASTYARLAPRPERRPTDLNAVARAVARDAAAPAGASLRTDLTEETPRVAADPVMLRRIVENLVVNALESLDGTGEVVLGTSVQRTATAPSVVLTVDDTGRGIEPAEVERIFEDFFSTKAHGTGLGLSIVRRLVTDLGGHIDVRSRPGLGTRFRIELPSLDPVSRQNEEPS